MFVLPPLQDNRLSASIISGLLHRGFEVHQVVHARSISETDHHVTIHKTGLSTDALLPVFRKVQPDVLFSTQSAGSFDFQKQIIEHAISAGIRRFVPAEFKEDALNERVQARLPPVKERARVIRYLQEQSSQGRIEWVAIATGCSLEHGLTSGTMGFDMKWRSATIHGSGKERFAASSSSWNGKIALKILEKWGDVKNEYLYAPGVMTCANEIFECVQRRTDRSWERGHVDVEEIVREAEKRFERGFPDAGMFLMERSLLCDKGADAWERFEKSDAKGRLGLDGEQLDEVVGKAVHDVEYHGHGDCGCG